MLVAGAKLGPYRILSPLGKGGMGEVYHAKDIRLERSVAIKVLPEHLASNPEALRRFEREARVLAALSHPNIVTIHDVGIEEGVSFVVMELLEGETLSARIRESPLDWQRALEIAVPVAEGLSAAHSKGVIHRDLKPANIFLGSDGRTKVLDFGLARWSEKGSLVDASSLATESSAGTKAGIVIGTLPYMSPEQVRGESADMRTDIFSFGGILYEMLTGNSPFLRNTPAETIAAILKETPCSISESGRNIPLELDRIAVHCLTKDPDQRFQTARDLVFALRGVESSRSGRDSISIGALDAEAGSNRTRPTSSAESIVSAIKRHRVSVIIAVIAVALAVAGLSLYLHARNNLDAIESIAVLPFQNQSTGTDAEYLSDGLTESLIYRLSQLPNLRVSPTSSVSRYKGKELDFIKVGQELGVNAVLSGRIMQRGDELIISAELVDVRYKKSLWGEHYDRTMSDLLVTQREIALEIVERLKLKVSGNDRALANYTDSNEAYQLYLKGRYYWNKRTGGSVGKALGYFNQAIEKDPSFALAYGGLADCYLVPANPQPPAETMPKAKGAAMRALELDETLAEAHTSLARVLMVYDRDWPGAEREYKRAIELNPRYAVAHQWYGGYLEATGRHQEAIAERKLALELDPLSLILNFELALGFYHAREYDQAIEQFQKAAELDPNFPPLYSILPAAYEQKRMYTEAITEFQKGMALAAGAGWSLTASGLGHVYAVSGREDEARKMINELKQLSGQTYVTAYGIALIYTGLGENDQAFAWLDKAYEAHSFHLTWINTEPRFDSLHRDPRFADLLRRLKLEH